MQMKALAYRVRWGLALVLALGVWLLMQPLTAWACGGGVICVDVDAPAGGDGQSWGTAYPSLHTALSAASAGNEIWVAEGTYYPGASGSRTATFQLVSGVAVYGGFAGTESSRDARNWTANVTALSGDLDASGDHTNNDAYHVVTGSGVTTTAVLDGFTITGGYANGSGASSDGAGVYNNAGSPTLANLVITANAGTHDGGGVININSSSPSLDHVILSDNSAASGGGMINLNGSSPTLTHVIFSSNAASAYGGGMRNYNNSHPTLTDVTFSTNTSANGGAMVNDNSSPTLINVTFQSNTATGNGGGMLNASSSHPTLTNVAFNSNTSVNAAGGGVFNDTNSHPTFVNVAFTSNTAATGGGGMYSRASNYTFTGGSFSGNTAQWGGGMVNNNNHPTLTDVSFTNNTASLNGGGMQNEVSGDPILTHVTFIANSASANGGGMYNTASSPALTNVSFSSNTASSSGGGMYNTASSPSLVNVALLFNTAQNFGGGMENLNGSSPSLVNVTLADNSAGRYGGGMDNYFSSSPVLTNTILWGNDATGGAQIWNSGSSVPVIASSDVQGAYAGGSWDSALGVDGGGNLDADPLFGAQSAYPPAGSPVLDIGDPAALPADTYDLDADGVLTETLSLDLEGGERVWGAGLDMGAYEFRIWYVDADAAPGNGCTAWADACPDLQTALALPPGEIWVAEGVYSPGISGTVTATFQLHNGQALYGGFAGTEAERAQRDWVTHAVTLTGDLDGSASFTAGDAYHVVTTRSTDRIVVLDGFTITGGNAPNVGGCTAGSVDGVCQGGGLINWYGNPTLTNLVIHRNQAFAGGGVFSRDGSPMLTNVTFSANTVAGGSYQDGGGMYSYGGSPILTEIVFSGNSGAHHGGGLWGYGVTLTDATFISNSASYGGGMYGSGGTLTQVTFESNSASGRGGGMYGNYNFTLTDVAFHSNAAGSVGGGGLYISSGSGVLSNVTFSSNSTSGSGGGVYNRGARSIIFTNVTFNGNTAGDRGGGLYNDSTQGSVALANVVFSGNAAAHGGGMYHSGFSSNPGSVALTHVTLSHNTASGTGGGIRLAEYAISRLNNTILWGNDAPDGAQINIGTPITATVASSNIQGSGGSGAGWDASLGAELGGNIDADPQFVSPIITTTMVPTTTGDYRLLAASPAIDVGDNNAVPAGVTTDLAGNPRIHNDVVDMGAYEASCTLVLSHSVTPTIDVPYHGVVTYTIALSNTGATDDPAVILTDTLPASVAFGQWVEQPGSSLVQNGSSFTWSGALAAGGGITLTFTATHTGDYGEVVTNTAHFSGTQQTGSAAVKFQVIPAYVITPTAGAGGSITPDTPQTVPHGSDLVFTIAPAAGYHISDVGVDGVSVGVTTTCTFGNVTADHTLSAAFALNTYIITPTVGAGGSISPTTPQTVSHGDDITFTITSDTGYHVSDVTVDGGSVGAVSTYTFTDVITHHTLSAAFALNTYIITPTVGAGGSISPTTPQTVMHGSDITFTSASDTGYHINDVWVDGGSVGAVGAYTFENVTADHTISAAFALNTYIITPTVGAGGSISPTTPQPVSHGDDITFTITPDTGYHVADVLVDGGSVGAVSAYTFTHVITHHTISAAFALNEYTLTVNSGDNGSVTRVPSQTIYLYGDVVTLTATADPGWYFGQWSGDASGILTQTTVTMTADKVVTATFVAAPPTHYTLTMSIVGSGVITPAAGIHSYLSGTLVSLSASPMEGWQFDGWRGAVTGTLTQTHVTMDADKDVTATFTAQPGHTIYLPLLLRGSSGSVR